MDIVERLRGDYGLPIPLETTPICHEAADEIERLRQQNAELLAALKDMSGAGYAIVSIYRAAIAKAKGGE